MAQRILVVDVGGTHLKILASGQRTPRKITSGPKMTARLMCNWVRKAASDWHYEVAAIGYPGPVVHGRPVHEPYNMSKGWAEYDACKDVVINLENDDLVSEDAFFVVKVIEAVNHPYLHALPDFADCLRLRRIGILSAITPRKNVMPEPLTRPSGRLLLKNLSGLKSQH